MTIEECIIKINEEEFVVDKQTYNLLLPLGKMIEELEKENQSLKDNWNKLKEWLEETQINKIDIDEWTIIQVRDKMQEIEKGDSDEISY